MVIYQYYLTAQNLNPQQIEILTVWVFMESKKPKGCSLCTLASRGKQVIHVQLIICFSLGCWIETRNKYKLQFILSVDGGVWYLGAAGAMIAQVSVCRISTSVLNKWVLWYDSECASGYKIPFDFCWFPDPCSPIFLWAT